METTGINTLLRAMPVSGIRGRVIATISDVPLFAPPAGQWLAFVNPVKLCSHVFQRESGLKQWEIEHAVLTAYKELRQTLQALQRPVILTNVGEECISLPAAADFLREYGFISTDEYVSLSKIAKAVCEKRIYNREITGPDAYHRLIDLPGLPPASAMMVTMAEIPEFWYKEESRMSWAIDEPPIDFEDWGENLSITFEDWRKEVMAIGKNLESILGKRVFSHSGRRSNKRGDRLHRWLALHYWCSFFPDSKFISYLCEAGGFSSTADLKSALVDPASVVSH